MHWSKERTARELRLKYLSRSIAQAMGWHFPMQELGSRYEITNGAGNIITISEQGYRDKEAAFIHVSAERATIGISRSKPPRQIAKEIKRRLFPRARINVLERKEKEKAYKERELSHLRAIMQLAKIAGVRYQKRKWSGKYGDHRFTIARYSECVISEGWSEEEKIMVKLDLRLTPAKAAHVLAIINA